MARDTSSSADQSQSTVPHYIWQNYFENVVGKTSSIPYQNFHLTSAFQPIFCVARRRVIGYEALVRAHNSTNENVSPLDLFGQCASSEERVHGEYYKDLGCLVALDDFGVDASDIRRIWQLSPNIVKLDRHIIAAAVNKRSAELAMRGLIGMLHELGSMVLIEGIENYAQPRLAVEANADLLQGYFLARPNEILPLNGQIAATAAANINHALEPLPHQKAYGEKIRNVAKIFERASSRFSRGENVANACEELLQHESIATIYVLDDEGKQLGRHIVGNHVVLCPLSGPLQDADGANWSRRPHFRGAKKGEFQQIR